jgi:hypothetical protein
MVDALARVALVRRGEGRGHETSSSAEGINRTTGSGLGPRGRNDSDPPLLCMSLLVPGLLGNPEEITPAA